ncbi:hypothetical protein H0H93_016491 [Arthromyces matolae]|nr:hypothetical protein H0H93_016491 [Arthromyces matolae]
MPTVPQDVLHTILSHLRGTSSIRDCALVSQTWLKIARYHLLPPPQSLELDQPTMVEFLQLYDAPLSSLKYVLFRELHLRQDLEPGDSYAEQRFHWRSRDPRPIVDTFLTKNLPLFSTINYLFLEWFDWDTLSPSALISLNTSFSSVKKLHLQYLAISKWDQLLHLISGFPALEKLLIGAGVPFDLAEDPSPAATCKIRHPNLRQLIFQGMVPSPMIRHLAHNIFYVSGIEFIFAQPHVFHASHEDETAEHFQAWVELLKTAGDHLTSFHIQPLYKPWNREESGCGLDKQDSPDPETWDLWDNALSTNYPDLDDTDDRTREVEIEVPGSTHRHIGIPYQRLMEMFGTWRGNLPNTAMKWDIQFAIRMA